MLPSRAPLHLCLLAAILFLATPTVAQDASTAPPTSAAAPGQTAYPTAEAVEANTGSTMPGKAGGAATAPGLRGVGSAFKPSKPPVSGDPRVALRAELLSLDALAAHNRVERKRLNTWGPVTLLATGYTVGTFFAIGALTTIGTRNDVNRNIDRGEYDPDNDFNDDGVVDATDRQINRSTAIIVTTVAAAHLGLGALGTWWLIKRARGRERLDHELVDLTVQRRLLELKLDASVSANGFSAQVGGRF